VDVVVPRATTFVVVLAAVTAITLPPLSFSVTVSASLSLQFDRLLPVQRIETFVRVPRIVRLRIVAFAV
jgi:hypothetical protein